MPKRRYRKKIKKIDKIKIGIRLLIAGFILTLVLFLLRPFIDSLFQQKLGFKEDNKLVLTKVKPEEKYPINISIQSLNLDLSVVPAVIKNKEWPVATDSANYLVGSSLPAEKGNIVIYGHALWPIFGPLLNINVDQQIILKTKNNQFYRYRVEETKVVWPNETKVIEETTDETLTLYTCYGWFDSQRFVVIAKPAKDKREVAKVKRVIDGRRIRYIGINTPEAVEPRRTVECFAKEAKEKNQELVEGKLVELEKDISETDKYGRYLRYVYVDDIFINNWLVENGYAQIMTVPPDVKFAKLFKEKEKIAREEKRGLWGECE